MKSGWAIADDNLEEQFTIHVLNNYTHMRLTILADLFDLEPGALQAVIRAEHRDLVLKLAAEGINYSELGSALVPKRGRYEVAFIFDSTRVNSNAYGLSLAEKWIPVVKKHGPAKTVMRVGDILHLPDELVWRELERQMVGPASFRRIARELYFVVYLTNLSAAQLADIDEALVAATDAYLGYVDCSTWNPLKVGLLLPQVGLRLNDQIITTMDDIGTANPVGYPYETSRFQVVGIPDDLYGPYLGHRLDNGIPDWADQDSAIALTVLGGTLHPAATSAVVIKDKRFDYLGRNHGASLSKAGLENLDQHSFAESIRQKVANGLIYNLRFVEGARAGARVPELDALMYSVQVEFPDESGRVKRYQVGLKYTADTHTSEVVTFY